jgi:hypothetical protein
MRSTWFWPVRVWTVVAVLGLVVACGGDERGAPFQGGFSGTFGALNSFSYTRDAESEFRLQMDSFEMGGEDIECMVDRLKASGLLQATGSPLTTVAVTMAQLDEWATQCTIRLTDLRVLRGQAD